MYNLSVASHALLFPLIKCLRVKYLIGIIMSTYWIALNTIRNCRPRTNWWFRMQSIRWVIVLMIHIEFVNETNSKRSFFSTHSSLKYCIEFWRSLSEHNENICFFFVRLEHSIELNLHSDICSLWALMQLYIFFVWKMFNFLFAVRIEYNYLYVNQHDMCTLRCMRTHEFLLRHAQFIFQDVDKYAALW